MNVEIKFNYFSLCGFFILPFFISGSWAGPVSGGGGAGSVPAHTLLSQVTHTQMVPKASHSLHLSVGCLNVDVMVLIPRGRAVEGETGVTWLERYLRLSVSALRNRFNMESRSLSAWPDPSACVGAFTARVNSRVARWLARLPFSWNMWWRVCCVMCKIWKHLLDAEILENSGVREYTWKNFVDLIRFPSDETAAPMRSVFPW